MPRQKNPIPTKPLTLSTTEKVLDDLRRLVETGYFGKTDAEAAERVLGERLRQFWKEQPEIYGKRPKK
jgi:hypothetical protein